ncbi:hypothetical protein H5410_021860 [Solanum commersonii]|uniref:Uncharacterized protein n=1 Tax=Solanum commersonii TaxID=4109 RepID=A0A9J5ZC90_SOLCO|nr:hypothetical protein H5410_021860 [Solanum commersonii]
MGAHNKTHFTHAKINCALKDSSCDSQLSKNLKLTILASNASSSSTKVFKFPHTKNDSIFTQWFNHLKFRNQMQYSLSQRKTQCILSPIGLPVFSNQQLFQLTQDQKGLFKACNGAECKMIGRYGTASRNYLVTRLLFYFIANLNFSFRAQHTRTKGDLQGDRRLSNCVRQSSGLHFFVLFSRFVPSCQVVSMLCLKL